MVRATPRLHHRRTTFISSSDGNPSLPDARLGSILSSHELSRKLLRADARDDDQSKLGDEDLAGFVVGDVIRIRRALRAGKTYLEVLEAALPRMSGLAEAERGP